MIKVFKPKKHVNKVDEAMTELYLLRQGLRVQQSAEALEKQVDKIRKILNDLKELLGEDKDII
jgi:hypothetical protein